MSAILTTLLFMTAATPWPALPAADGQVDIPAQDCPRHPAPRTVKVYIVYPGGALENVQPSTGLLLALHNWGGTGWRGAPEPAQLVDRYNVISISVDYLQSGPYDEADQAQAPYDCGFFQALDALRALYFVYHALEERQIPFDATRIFSTGGSGGGNVTLMVNKLAPRTFTAAINLSGMAKLPDDLAFGTSTRTTLNAFYSPDPESPFYLSPDAQAIRNPGDPAHAALMKQLGNTCKLLFIHGTTDPACPVQDAHEVAASLQHAGLDIQTHFITDADLDGEALTNTGHSLGNRTLILHRFAEHLLKPGGSTRPTPNDFDLKDENVSYPTPTGAYIISYTQGYPIARFQPAQ